MALMLLLHDPHHTMTSCLLGAGLHSRHGAVKWSHSIRQVAHTCLSQGSCIGCVSTPREIEHSSSLITDSVFCGAASGALVHRWVAF